MTRTQATTLRLAVTVALVVGSISGVGAYSNGAGGDCPSGRPAVEDAHLIGDIWGTNRPVVQMSLVDAGLRFTINNVDLTVPDDKEGYQLRHQGDYEFAVQAEDNTQFKGVLIRVTQASDSGVSEISFLPGRNSQTALSCSAAGAAGVTHTDAQAKSFLSGFFRSSRTEPVQIDVTVVLSNNSTGSLYAYQSFGLDVFDSHLTSAPSATPFTRIDLPISTPDESSVPDAEDPRANDGLNLSGVEGVFGCKLVFAGVFIVAAMLFA